METQPDFRELLALFSAHRVEYLIVGGYALAFHGAPRFTGDLDIFVKPDAANAQRILTALEAFGFASVGLTPSDFAHPDQVIQLGVPPVRIDLITSITGVSWEEAWAGRTAGSYGDIPVYCIGRGQFITNKRATGRPRARTVVRASRARILQGRVRFTESLMSSLMLFLSMDMSKGTLAIAVRPTAETWQGANTAAISPLVA